MPRRLRRIAPGALHHVGHHTNLGRRMFASARDRRSFLRMLGETASDHGLEPLSWCLMGNHYHLLLRDVRGVLPEAMRDLNSGYARRCNARDEVRGTVLWQRYFDVPVETDDQLLAALRYIALNPVAAGYVERPEAWTWSSFGAWSHDVADPVVPPDAISAELRRALTASISDALGTPPETWLPPAQLPAPVLAEVRPPLPSLVLDRDERAAARLARSWWYGLREIGEALGVSQSTVHRWLAESQRKEVPDPIFR